MRQIRVQPDVWLGSLERPYSFESPFRGRPYVLLLASRDPLVPQAQMMDVASAIISSGCRWVCCAGDDCELWHNAIDFASVSRSHDSILSEEQDVMTTDHKGENWHDMVWFLFNCADTEATELKRFLILTLSGDRQYEMMIEEAVREVMG